MFGAERALTDETRLLVEIDEASQVHLIRRVHLRCDHRLPAAEEIHLDQQQACLDAGDIEREHACGLDVERLAAAHQPVPHLDRALGRHPDLVA